MIRKRLRSTLSARSPPDHGQEQRRPELGEDDDADEGARVREVVGVGAEDHVLHPGADVRGEGTEEDDAEGPVREGGSRRAPTGRERAVPVDDGVLDLLDRDGAVDVPFVWIPRHTPIVGERVLGRSWRSAGAIDLRLVAFSTPPWRCATVRTAPALCRGGPSSAKSGRNPALSRNGEAPARGRAQPPDLGRRNQSSEEGRFVRCPSGVGSGALRPPHTDGG